MKHDNMNEYALPFAAWELRLYLDTHPDDECALNEYRRLCASIGDKCNYACHTVDAHGGYSRNGNTRSVTRENDCGCGGDARGMNHDGGYGRKGNTCGMSREPGNGGGGNYGGCRCDSGNYAISRGENSDCGCEGKNDGHDRVNVWSWIEGPWPWEPEANVTGGDC